MEITYKDRENRVMIMDAILKMVDRGLSPEEIVAYFWPRVSFQLVTDILSEMGILIEIYNDRGVHKGGMSPVWSPRTKNLNPDAKKVVVYREDIGHIIDRLRGRDLEEILR